MMSPTENASISYKLEIEKLVRRNKIISSEIKDLKSERQRNNKKIKLLDKEWLEAITKN